MNNAAVNLTDWNPLEISELMVKDSMLGIPSCPVIRTLHFHSQGPGSVPGRGTKIPQHRGVGKKKKHAIKNVLTFPFVVKMVICVKQHGD